VAAGVTICEQTGVSGQNGPAKLHHNAAVELESQSAAFGFSNLVRHA
jgi:hypothetical protein